MRPSIIQLAFSFVLGVLVLVAPLRAQESSPPAEPRHWKGAIELPGGMSLDFTIVLPAEGSGTISIPMQGAKDVPLSSTSVEGKSLRFVLAPPGAPEAAHAKFDLTIAEDGQSATGTLNQMGHSLPVKMERITGAQVADTEPKRPQTPKPPFPYDEREITFVSQSGGVTLAGTLTVPKEPAPPAGHPTVILITGSGAQDRNESLLGHQPFFVLADHLSRHGIAVLRCDDRGVGGSTGNVMLSTSADFAEDVLSAIEEVKNQPGIDPGRIGLLGHSEGGIIAPMVAAQSPDVKFVVMLAGTGLPGKDILRLQSEALLRSEGKVDEEALAAASKAHTETMDMVLREAPPEEVKPKIAELAALQIKAAGAPAIDDDAMNQVVEQQYASITSPWMRSFLALDPRDSLRKVRAPVLALIGERDVQVPARANLPEIEAALKEAGNPDATVAELPGLNHLFQTCTTGAFSEYAEIEETISPAALDTITLWIRERTGLD